jgi:hypothetical protein
MRSGIVPGRPTTGTKRLRSAVLAGAVGIGICLAATNVQAACAFKGKGTVCKGDFSAMALLITDPNWRAKWDTPPETTPHLRGSDKLGKGEKGTLLTFVTAGRGGPTELACEVTVKDPQGKVQKHPAQLCYRGDMVPGHIHLTGLEIALEGDGEPGKAEFTIGIKNMKTGTRLSLKQQVIFTQ